MLYRNFYVTLISNLIVYSNVYKITILRLDLRNCNINNTEFEKLPEDKIPDIILVLRPSQSKNTAGDKNNGPSKRKRIRKHSLNVADSECDTSTQAVNTNFSSSEDEYVSFGEEDEDETLEFFNMDTSFDGECFAKILQSYF